MQKYGLLNKGEEKGNLLERVLGLSHRSKEACCGVVVLNGKGSCAPLFYVSGRLALLTVYSLTVYQVNCEMANRASVNCASGNRETGNYETGKYALGKYALANCR